MGNPALRRIFRPGTHAAILDQSVISSTTKACWATFADSAQILVMRWGPAWIRRRVLGRPIGVWLAAVLWLLSPAGCLVLLLF